MIAFLLYAMACWAYIVYCCIRLENNVCTDTNNFIYIIVLTMIDQVSPKHVLESLWNIAYIDRFLLPRST